MTLFFNLDTLEKTARTSVEFISLLGNHYHKRLPTRKEPRKAVSLKGESFILNPEPLFSTKVDSGYVVQYIKLAAKRDYGLYKHYGTKSLLLSYYPDINLEAIKTNPLLVITDSEIHFLYEDKEIKNGISIRQY